MAIRRRKVRKTREEKAEDTRRILIEAAAKVIGRFGYAEASIARITAHAKVAQGTFYNYFESRQDLFDLLLPELGAVMLAHIQERVDIDRTGVEREEERLRAYFDYLADNPEFYRILNEAEIFAPKAYQSHFRILISGYTAALKRSRERGEVDEFDDDELEVVAYMLLAARGYLSMGYAVKDGRARIVPEYLFKAYSKFVNRGLFKR